MNNLFIVCKTHIYCLRLFFMQIRLKGPDFDIEYFFFLALDAKARNFPPSLLVISSDCSWIICKPDNRCYVNMSTAY
jgi:hypothetical protein